MQHLHVNVRRWRRACGWLQWAAVSPLVDVVYACVYSCCTGFRSKLDSDGSGSGGIIIIISASSHEVNLSKLCLFPVLAVGRISPSADRAVKQRQCCPVMLARCQHSSEQRFSLQRLSLGASRLNKSRRMFLVPQRDHYRCAGPAAAAASTATAGPTY